MKKNYLLIILISLLVISPKLYAQVLPATCDDLVTNIDMWGQPARGVDLRAYTNSTLHWIGCPSGGSCEPDDFFCNFDPNTQTLSFGSAAGDASPEALRAAVDPDNAEGDTMPNANLSPNGCCSTEFPLFGLCNAPDANNNGVPIDAADALCNALGYESGSLTWVQNNTCPEANTITADGSDWTSDFVRSEGYGKTYTCVGFPPPPAVPTLSQWGLIALASILGIVALMVMRRRKVTA